MELSRGNFYRLHPKQLRISLPSEKLGSQILFFASSATFRRKIRFSNAYIHQSENRIIWNNTMIF